MEKSEVENGSREAETRAGQLLRAKATIPSPYLTTKEAVAYTHTSAKTLRRAELAGELQSFRPGKVKLYRITDLDQWVASKESHVVPESRLVRPKLSDLIATTP